MSLELLQVKDWHGFCQFWIALSSKSHCLCTLSQTLGNWVRCNSSMPHNYAGVAVLYFFFPFFGFLFVLDAHVDTTSEDFLMHTIVTRRSLVFYLAHKSVGTRDLAHTTVNLHTEG